MDAPNNLFASGVGPDVVGVIYVDYIEDVNNAHSHKCVRSEDVANA